MNDTGNIRQICSHPRLHAWLAAAMTVGLLVGARPAQGATGECEADDFASLSNPLVTVVDGRGDLAHEQAIWATVSDSNMYGLEIEIGRQTFRMTPK